MSAVNRQFRLAVRLAETFASASRSLSGWAREAREVQRRTGRASAADRRESRHCLTMINGRCAQIAAIGQGQADIPFGPCGQGLRHECAVADMVSKASDPAARIRHEGRCWPPTLDGPVVDCSRRRQPAGRMFWLTRNRFRRLLLRTKHVVLRGLRSLGYMMTVIRSSCGARPAI